MKIRKTNFNDLEKVLKIYEHARQYMIQNNNPNQWKNTNPTKEQIIDDIKNNNSYVCLDNNEIVGVFYFNIDVDPTYLKINGSWLNEDTYGVVHRIASLNNKKGVGTFCLNYAFNQCNNLKIDTHKDNIPMKSLLNKLGFKYCGIIHLLNGEERQAFQKCLKGE